MTEHKHTPGKWELEAGRCIVTSDGRFTIHKANDWNPERICELDANARLIAAAPDMAEALFVALDTLSNIADEGIDMHTFNEGGIGYDAVQSVRAALAAATGAEVVV